MSEGIPQPIEADISTINGPILGISNKNLEFDMSAMTANKTAYVPNSSIILPIAKTTDLVLGNTSHSATAGNNVLIGITSALGGSHTGAIVLGNSTTSDASNQFKLKTDITDIYIPGLASGQTSTYCKFNNTTGVWSQSAFTRSSLAGITVANNATLNFAGDNTVGITQKTGSDNTLTFWNNGESCTFTQTQFIVAADGEESIPSYTFLSAESSGMYRPENNHIAFSNLTTMSMYLGTQAFFPLGTKSAPSLSFIADSDTGFYYKNRVRCTAGGEYVASFSQNTEATAFKFLTGSKSIELLNGDISFNNQKYLDIIDNGFSLNGELALGRYMSTYSNASLALVTDDAKNAFGKAIAFSPDGYYFIATASNSIGNEFYNIYRRVSSTWTVCDTLVDTHAYPGTQTRGASVACSCFGNRIAFGNSTAKYVVTYNRLTESSWDSDNRSYITSSNDQFGASIGMSNDGKYLVISDQGGRYGYGCAWLYTWTSSWVSAVQLFNLNNNLIQGQKVVISGDASKIAITTNKGLIYVFNISANLVYTLDFEVESQPNIAISGDGNTIAALINDTVKVWRSGILTGVVGKITVATRNDIAIDHRGDHIVVSQISDCVCFSFDGQLYTKSKTFFTALDTNLAISNSLEYIAVSNPATNAVTVGYATAINLLSRLPIAADQNTSVSTNHPEYTFTGTSENYGIGRQSGKVAIFLGSDSHELVIGGQDIYCNTNNAFNLGSGSKRFNEVYSVNGTVITSDRKYKTDIEKCPYGLNELKKIESYKYNLSSTKKNIGFIAQEVEEIIPEIVCKNQFYGMKYHEIIPVIINAIKELA